MRGGNWHLGPGFGSALHCPLPIGSPSAGRVSPHVLHLVARSYGGRGHLTTWVTWQARCVLAGPGWPQSHPKPKPVFSVQHQFHLKCLGLLRLHKAVVWRSFLALLEPPFL